MSVYRTSFKTVPSPVHHYLTKWFDLWFMSYPPEWLTQALACFEGEAQRLFLSDVSCVYPTEAEAGEMTRGIVEIVETDATMEAIFYYRLERALFLREPNHPALRYFANLMRTKTSIEIYYSANIGPRFNIGHGAGLVIGPGHTIGSDFVVYGNVTLGQRRRRSPRETMVIGNHCTVCTGATVLGEIRIGDNVRIAAGAVLLADADSNSTYAGVPAIKVAATAPLDSTL